MFVSREASNFLVFSLVFWLTKKNERRFVELLFFPDVNFNGTLMGKCTISTCDLKKKTRSFRSLLYQIEYLEYITEKIYLFFQWLFT